MSRNVDLLRIGKSVKDRFDFAGVFLMVACFIVGGVAGVASILFCRYLLSFGGRDSTEKHGISSNEATRLGGALIVIFLFFHLCIQSFVIEFSTFPPQTYWLIGASFSFFLVGLYEDLKGVLSARFRFAFMIVLAGIWIFLFPDFTLYRSGIDFIDGLFFVNPTVAFLTSCLCLVFLTNAFNTADGANGLVSGISLFVILALVELTDSSLEPLLYAVAVSCVLFLLYNLGTGRFFLGDGGAYFLGSIIGLLLILTSNETEVSPWYLIALIFYPIVDLVWSISRRLVAGRSPFSPDDEHLHNLVFSYVVKSKILSTQANTLTGLGIASVYSGIPYLLFATKSIESSSLMWSAVCGVLLTIYLIAWQWLYRKICVVEG